MLMLSLVLQTIKTSGDVALVDFEVSKDDKGPNILTMYDYTAKCIENIVFNGNEFRGCIRYEKEKENETEGYNILVHFRIVYIDIHFIIFVV